MAPQKSAVRALARVASASDESPPPRSMPRAFALLLGACVLGIGWLWSIQGVIRPVAWTSDVEVSVLVRNEPYNDRLEGLAADGVGKESPGALVELGIDPDTGSEAGERDGDKGEGEGEGEGEGDGRSIADRLEELGQLPEVQAAGVFAGGDGFPKTTSYFEQTQWPIRVALFKGTGASVRSWQNLRRILKCAGKDKIVVVPVENANMARVNRADFDVLFLPGGSSGDMIRGHRERGSTLSTTIKAFLRDGGGYAGICGGAYVARVYRFTSFDAKGTMQGAGAISGIKLARWMESQAPKKMSNDTRYLNRKRLFYANGPFFLDVDFKQPLAKFTRKPRVVVRTLRDSRLVIDHEKPKATITRYQWRPIVVANEYMRGNVIISTGHPESDISKGYSHIEASQCGTAHANIVLNMIMIAANRTREDVVRFNLAKRSAEARQEQDADAASSFNEQA